MGFLEEIDKRYYEYRLQGYEMQAFERFLYKIYGALTWNNIDASCDISSALCCSWNLGLST